MPVELIVGLVGFIAVIAGGVIQYFAGASTEKWKHTTQLRTESYKNFLKAVAGIASAQKRLGPEASVDFYAMLMEAKAQIALYGSEQVTKATAHFFREFGHLQTDEASDAFVRIACAMRDDSYARRYHGFAADFSALLLGGGK